MEEKIRELELEQRTLRRVVWVLGVMTTISTIFGFIGVFGINKLLRTESEISGLQVMIDELSEKSNAIESKFKSIRKEQEDIFNKYIESKKVEFNTYVSQAISQELTATLADVQVSPKWEYMIIHDLPNERTGVLIGTTEEGLNSAGQEGWEAVAIAGNGATILKRRLD